MGTKTCPKCGAPMESTRGMRTVSLFYEWKCTKCDHFEGYGSAVEKPKEVD